MRVAKLPNPENAVVEIRKLRDYCLSHEHPRGRHKDRVFRAALGLEAEDAGLLQAALLSAAPKRRFPANETSMAGGTC